MTISKVSFFRYFLVYISLTMSCAAFAQAPQEYLLLDSAQLDSPGLPRNWRSSVEPVRAEMLSKTIPLNSKGLEMSQFSGSAEFSEREISFLKSEKFKEKKVTVIDLRQEPHGLVNGNAISWYKEYDSVNEGKVQSEIETDEVSRLAQLETCSNLDINKILHRVEPPNPANWEIEKVIVAPQTVVTEQTMLKGMGIGYFRITAPDYHPPRNEDVDRFVSFAKGLSSEEWLHFHCFAGRGRTTTFMAIYDMMRNYDKASAAEIIDRQRAIGGIDLAATPKEKDTFLVQWAAERNVFILKFYQYCQQEGPRGFQMSWSEWSKIGSSK